MKYLIYKYGSNGKKDHKLFLKGYQKGYVRWGTKIKALNFYYFTDLRECQEKIKKLKERSPKIEYYFCKIIED